MCTLRPQVASQVEIGTVVQALRGYIATGSIPDEYAGVVNKPAMEAELARFAEMAGR